MRKHRHTLERRNAPYRGLSRQEDFVLPYTKAVRDLTRLLYIAGEEGHRQQTDGLLDRMVAGRKGDLRHSVLPGGKIVKVEQAEWGQSLDGWESVGGATVTPEGRGWLLSEEGLLDPAGVRLRVAVNPGDVLWMSMFVRPSSGDVSGIRFGSSRINNGEEELKNIDLSEEIDGIWVDKRLYCDEKEEVEMSILLHKEPSILGAGAIYIEDFEWGFAFETETGLTGYDYIKDVELRRLSHLVEAIERGGK